MLTFLLNPETWPIWVAMLAIISLEGDPAPPVPGPPANPAPPPPAPAPPPTGLAYVPACLEHETGPDHPEQPGRLRAVIGGLEMAGLMERLLPLPVAPAPFEALADVHSPEYIAEVQQACRSGASYLHAPDTPVSPRSYDAARLAAGGVIAAIDAIMVGRAANAFCAARPPGHHASRSRAMGFCLFNNAAVGARYAQQRYGLQRILIVDWDVHHGNGTQAIFLNDPTVLCFSVHQYPFYPGTGAASETGAGPGRGYTINAPLPAASGDAEYLQVFETLLRPRALDFAPDMILVSAGFDALAHDPLGGMNVTVAGFAQMTRIVRQIAAQTCGGRLVSLLEGGYRLDGLGAAVAAHVAELIPPG